jgi:hypothetical protein
MLKYDEVPRTLRAQVVLTMSRLFHYGRPEDAPIDSHWGAGPYKEIRENLCLEYGVLQLLGESYQRWNSAAELQTFVMEKASAEQVLDVVEQVLRTAEDRCWNEFDDCDHEAMEIVRDATQEMNQRLLEAGVGYQYESRQIVRLDSDLLHVQAVKPALTLLGTLDYGGPRDEFLRAHEHYRHGRHEVALLEAAKAFESTMKCICAQKGWQVGTATPNAAKLINVCLENGLVDSFWTSQLQNLNGLLQGVSTARNQRSGHGAGTEVREVPPELVRYALHMTASTIVFLIESANRK